MDLIKKLCIKLANKNFIIMDVCSNSPTENINTVELHLSGRWLSGTPIIRIGSVLRVNMPRNLKISVACRSVVGRFHRITSKFGQKLWPLTYNLEALRLGNGLSLVKGGILCPSLTRQTPNFCLKLDPKCFPLATLPIIVYQLSFLLCCPVIGANESTDKSTMTE